METLYKQPRTRHLMLDGCIIHIDTSLMRPSISLHQSSQQPALYGRGGIYIVSSCPACHMIDHVIYI